MILPVCASLCAGGDGFMMLSPPLSILSDLKGSPRSSPLGSVVASAVTTVTEMPSLPAHACRTALSRWT